LQHNKEFTHRLAQDLGCTYFMIGNKRWHLNELLSIQNILLCNAPSLKEGILWWSKSVSLFDRTLYIDSQQCSGYLSVSFHTQSNTSLPNHAYSFAQYLLLQLANFTEFHHSWMQSKYDHFLQLRMEFGSGLKIHFDVQEINSLATPEPELFALAKQVLGLLKTQHIGKEDLIFRLKKQISEHIDSPLRLQDLAKHLSLSPRTLQRRLEDKQLSFSTLVDNEKKSVALRLLADTDLPVSLIASRLGYGDSSNFNRAFRKWYSFTPQSYREQCSNNRVLQKSNPIRLHYAQWRDNKHEMNQGRVWLEVDNIAFEKNVTVECQDRDGVWRHYPAFFDSFLSAGTELWSTANLPVASPLTFKLSYEISGDKFINDNHQHNFVVHENLLIGSPLVVLPTMVLVNEGQGFRMVIELACRKLDIDKIDCMIDHQSNSPIKMTKSSGKNSYVYWSLSHYCDRLPQRCFFTLQTLEGEQICCANQQQGYLFATSPSINDG
jgi:AraC-like DNA-binding protein